VAGTVMALAMTVTAAAVRTSLNIEYLLADFD
jgi:hypothetical protein